MNGGESGVNGVHIRRDSIKTSEAQNRDNVKSIQKYRVLGIYNKHQNKWYMEVTDEVLWNSSTLKAKKTWRIMASMVRQVGTEDFEDVRADVIGEWMHSSVYLSEVISVIGSVVQM